LVRYRSEWPKRRVSGQNNRQREDKKGKIDERDTVEVTSDGEARELAARLMKWQLLGESWTPQRVNRDFFHVI
jgi:hypothetical protein